MKIAVECKSPLMQKSLELFLDKHLTSVKHSDIILRDVKCLGDERCLYISSSKEADLVKPFSKSQLFLALENRYKSINKDVSYAKNIEDEPSDEDSHERAPFEFEILEKRIESLTIEYQENILKAVKAFYEK